MSPLPLECRPHPLASWWQGLALDTVRSSPNPVRSFAYWVLAGVVAALLLPAHLLASRLVYGKVRAALGIKKVSRGPTQDGWIEETS